jgi:hypothetical protein
MNPIINNFWTAEERSRHGIRGIDDFTAAELALLLRKVEAWVSQRSPQSGGNRRRTPFVMKRRTAASAEA